jgi:hypothetical protein
VPETKIIYDLGFDNQSPEAHLLESKHGKSDAYSHIFVILILAHASSPKEVQLRKASFVGFCTGKIHHLP